MKDSPFYHFIHNRFQCIAILRTARIQICIRRRPWRESDRTYPITCRP